MDTSDIFVDIIINIIIDIGEISVRNIIDALPWNVLHPLAFIHPRTALGDGLKVRIYPSAVFRSVGLHKKGESPDTYEVGS